MESFNDGNIVSRVLAAGALIAGLNLAGCASSNYVDQSSAYGRNDVPTPQACSGALELERAGDVSSPRYRELSNTCKKYTEMLNCNVASSSQVSQRFVGGVPVERAEGTFSQTKNCSQPIKSFEPGPGDNFFKGNTSYNSGGTYNNNPYSGNPYNHD